MKKAILFFLTSAFGLLQAQVATNFIANDCNSNSHNLFSDLDAGNVVVLCWVMPCGNCVTPATNAYNIVQSYSVSNPGKIKFYLCDDVANTSCATLNNWASTNGLINISAFSNSAIKMTDYGSSGMPKIVIVSGGKSHQVYFNQNNTLNTANFTNSLNKAIAASTGPTYSVQPARTVTFTAAMSNITINDIFQPNTSNSKIILKWELVSINLPTTWQYSMCDYQTCHPGIPQGPTTMDTIPVGGKGLMGLNIDPGTETGSGVVKVIVYQDGFKVSADTLTWFVNTGTVGLDELFAQGSICVYPNPAKSILKVATPVPAKCYISDVNGKIVSSADLNAGNNELQITELPHGVYFMQLSNSESRQTLKILKE